MPFIKRFLHINKIYNQEVPVEVVLLSKNSPETGIRIFNAIKSYGLDISRAAFTSGKSPYKYSATQVKLHSSKTAGLINKTINNEFYNRKIN